ncbi:MAG TPA: hypothetical protein VF779_06980 [Pyrinomonadaceae bacterium]
MQGITKHRLERFAASCLLLALFSLIQGCGGSLYKVKPRVDAPITGSREASAGGFTVRAVPLLTDEESQELFEANLLLAGLLPVRVEMSNETGAQVEFKRVRFTLHDAAGRIWKMRTSKQAVSRILSSDEVYLYNPNSRKKFEQEMGAHVFDLTTPLEAGQRRQGLIFFQTPKKEQVESPRSLVLTIEGLPQPVAVTLN